MSEREKELQRQVADLEAAYEELQKTKQMLAARTVIAWMGMANSAWRHSIQGKAIAILNYVEVLRRCLNAEGTSDESNRFIVEGIIEGIERAARLILEKPITAPLSSEEGVETIFINDLLRERVGRLLQNEPYRGIQIIWKLGPDDRIVVRASPEWLKKAVDILIGNAVEAMLESPRRILSLSTLALDDRVEIHVSDTGHGISEEVLPKLFKERVKRPRGEEALGIGLLLASMITQTYGGDISIATTSSQGTTFVISLPQAK